MRAVRHPLFLLLTTALATALALSISACGGASPDKPNKPNKPDSTTTKAKASATPTTTVLGKAGPKVGACVSPKHTSIVMVNETVDCTLAHTGEVTKVVTVPGGTLNPERKADQKRAAKAGATCPDARDYIGYDGILYGTWNTVRLGPAKAAQEEGAAWLACVAIEYKAIKRVGKRKIYPFLERTGTAKGKITGDKAYLTDMFCSDTATGGQFHGCQRGKGNWTYLAYRPSPKPFVSDAHQERWSRSFCNAASLAYGVDTEWRTWWANKAKHMSSVEQYCVIPFDDFRSSQATLRPRTSQTEFKSATETRFAKKLTSVGKRAATEPDLMSEAAQSLRSDTNDVAVFQHKLLCTVVDCGSRTTVKGTREGPTMSFRVALPVAGKACTGNVVFAIGYLGAPFTVEKVSCA